MSLLQSLSDFLESIFKANSPEVQRKQKLKKIDAELKALPSGIYKNGLLQANFAEAIRLLYINTKPIANILENTISSPDVKHNGRYEYQLIISCYPSELQELLGTLDYETRKQEVILGELESVPAQRTFDAQHRKLEKIIQHLNTKEMLKINDLFSKLKTLSDLCRFNFINCLQAFDNHFNGLDPKAVPQFTALTPSVMENFFQDLYYITADYKMNMTVANAVIALGQLYNHDSLTGAKQKELISNLKVIESVFHKVLTPDILKRFIRLVKQEPDLEPEYTTHTSDIRRSFSEYIQGQYQSNEFRIKGELKDVRIQAELQNLFNDSPMVNVKGYNEDLNTLLVENSSANLSWMTPMKILKSFVTIYYPDSIRSLLNDIVIEGFFNNPTFKSQFSATVFAANEVEQNILEFEESFDKDGINDQAIIRGYIRDSHRDPDFIRKLTATVEHVNNSAKQLIQKQVSTLYSLYIELGDLIQDSKKPTCEVVSNLKVLLGSSRNRDNSDFLERQYEKWKMFFEIMKNYAIIIGADKK